MLAKIRDKNVWLIYGAVFLLGIAYGISIALTSLQLAAHGFAKEDIGTLAAIFAAGIVLLSLPMGALIRRFSAKRTLVASLAGYAVCVAVFPLFETYAGIAVARFFDGAFSVGIWVSCETILLARAGKDHKAFVTSLYAIALSLGYVLGPIAAMGIVAVASMETAFFTSGIIASAASLLILLRLDPDDGTASSSEGHGIGTTDWRTLLWRIKTSCVATFAYGYFQASVVLFLPLFLIERKGIAEGQTILIPAFFAGGMLLFSNYAGRLGDRFGHLLVMRILAAIGTVMVALFVWLESWPLMCGAIFVAGATLASISPVSLALQGVIAKPADYARSNAIYNVFYASGMLLGPPISSVVYARFGGGAMLGQLAAMWAGFVLFSMVFFKDDPRATRPAPAEEPRVPLYSEESPARSRGSS